MFDGAEMRTRRLLCFDMHCWPFAWLQAETELRGTVRCMNPSMSFSQSVRNAQYKAVEVARSQTGSLCSANYALQLAQKIQQISKLIYIDVSQTIRRHSTTNACSSKGDSAQR